jgi:hypothetical protein
MVFVLYRVLCLTVHNMRLQFYIILLELQKIQTETDWENFTFYNLFTIKKVPLFEFSVK